MAQHEPIRRRTGPPAPPREIPDKLYFRIGEVAKLCEVPAYVLRFWESEFPQLKPNKGGTGQRLYRRRDVEMALRVKTLLYDEGYTIAGARQAFKAELRTGKAATPGSPSEAESSASQVDSSHLLAIQKELREILALLSKAPSDKPAVQSIRPLRPVLAPRPGNAPMQFPGPKAVKPEPRKPTPMPARGLFDSIDDE